MGHALGAASAIVTSGQPPRDLAAVRLPPRLAPPPTLERPLSTEGPASHPHTSGRDAGERRTIRRLVTALVWRERLLLLGRVLLQGLGLTLAVLLLAVLAATFSWDRSIAALVLVLTGGIGAFALVAAPLIAGWGRAGDPIRQARRVEALRPELEGRLLTLVERLDGPRPNESAAILGLVARRAAERLAGLSPGRVHRSWPLAAGAGGVLLALLLTLGSSLFAPGGPFGVVSWWLRGNEAVAALAPPDPTLGADKARVGDLVLEYVYPTYTGLDPLEVTNSTGEAHGPPGTSVRVRARSAEPVEAAAVVAYDSPTEGTTVEGGRVVRGRFTIGEDEGTWHLELHRGERTTSSVDFPITPDPDLAPEVLVDGPRRLEVPLDAPIELPWAARDDYGLTRVVLLLDEQETTTLRTFDDRTAESSGTLSFTPAQLGMSVGMRVKLQVGAWDNNAWSGEQLGVSQPPIELVVQRAEDLATLGPEERLALRDTLVDLLAGQLLEPWPPGRTSADVARAGEAFDAHYDPLRDFAEDTPGVYRDRFVARLVQAVQRTGQDFVAYTQVNFDRDRVDETPERQLVVQAGELRTLAVEEVEYAVILLDRYVQMRALMEVLREAETLARLGDRLERLLDSDAAEAEVQTALGRLDPALERLEEAVAHMDQDSTRSMVERRQRELGLLREEVGKALTRGDRDEADELARRLSGQLRELQEDLEYRLQALEEEENELAQKMKDVVAELKRLEREQRQLQGRVREAREAADAQGAAEAERLWKEVERLADEATERGEELAERARAFDNRTVLDDAARMVSRLGEAARSRDLRKARADASNALGSWTSVTYQRRVPRSASAPIIDRIERAERLLDRLEQAAGSVDPQAAAQARAMQEAQDTLDEELGAARELASEVAAQMPIEPRGMEEALEQADQTMDLASEDLQGGRPMPAEGSQGQAAERIKEAREALEQAMQQMAASGPGAGEPSEGEEGGEDAEGADVDLEGEPAAWNADNGIDRERFDLDAFQRDVLRGARGDVPDAYRALKKRYYEELMTQ
jgi:hypothetical protein